MDIQILLEVIKLERMAQFHLFLWILVA